MADSIYKDILYNNRLQTENYVNDTIMLVKSIVIKNDSEAILYNKYLITLDSSYDGLIDFNDRTTWRYYKHLAGELHFSDPQTLTIVSMDTGTTITFDKNNLSIHRLTRRELLKYGTYYSDFITRYPDQELYIKSLINEVTLTPAEIVDKPDFSIISYNQGYVENQEIDVMLLLEDRIQNYKVQNLLSQYQHADNLFIASQYIVLYNYMLTSLLGIRLSLAKTPQAHTYHLFMYLASHMRLDNEYDALSREQLLYFYRNTKYLTNHTGMNRILYELTERIFFSRSMNLTTYDFKQQFSLDTENRPNYIFKQRDVKPGIDRLSVRNYSLDDIIEKENVAFPQNEKEYEFKRDGIKELFHDSLHTDLKTKDFESVFVNDSNSVKYKIYDVVLDLIVYYTGNDLLRPLIVFNNPSDNRDYSLSSQDALKFFTLCLYYYNDIDISSDSRFPGFLARRIFRETGDSNRHDPDYYLDRMIDVEINMRDKIREIVDTNVTYLEEYNLTNFKETLISLYTRELALWLVETNEGSLYNQGNFQWLNNALHQHYLYEFDVEKPEEFIVRLSLENLKDTTKDNLLAIMNSILNGFTNDLFLELGKIKDIQETLVRMFEKFRSYTTHVIDTYTATDSLLVGPKDTRSFFLGVENLFYITSHEVRVYVDSVTYQGSTEPDEEEATTGGYVQIPSTQEQLEWLMFNHYNVIYGD